jgi:hypothetical protein
MTASSRHDGSQPGAIIDRWRAFWFRAEPAYTLGLVRLAFGASWSDGRCTYCLTFTNYSAATASHRANPVSPTYGAFSGYGPATMR